MQQPLVSVIIPTFNRENLIVRSVQSVLKQTYKNIELIIVDDGSTDNTKTVLDGINDLRLKLIQTDGRKGANYARNLGVSNSQGDLIAFQDSDDVWQVDKLQIQVEKLINLEMDAVFSSFIRVSDNGVGLLPFKNNIKDMTSRDGMVVLEDCLRANVISTQVLLIKKSVFNQLNGFDNSLKRLQDWDFAIRLLEKYKVYFVNKTLATVYEQKDSITLIIGAAEAREILMKKHLKIYESLPSIFMKVKYDLFKVRLRNLIKASTPFSK